jgi:hypothetical protein
LDYASGRVFQTVSARKGEDVFTAFLEQPPRTTPSDASLGVALDHAGKHKSLALLE